MFCANIKYQANPHRNEMENVYSGSSSRRTGPIAITKHEIRRNNADRPVESGRYARGTTELPPIGVSPPRHSSTLHSPFLSIISHHRGILVFDSGTRDSQGYRHLRKMNITKGEYECSEIGLNQRNQISNRRLRRLTRRQSPRRLYRPSTMHLYSA
jgi:hypothetical protein